MTDRFNPYADPDVGATAPTAADLRAEAKELRNRAAILDKQADALAAAERKSYAG